MDKQPAKKTATKKTTASKKTAATVKKAPAKKATVKKAVTKKVVTKKAPAKKAPAKKVATKKVAVKKTTAKKALNTNIVAYADVGFGNTLYIRGEGAGLSWEKGVAMKNTSAAEWAFATTKATGTITFKFLINDQIWAEGDDLTIKAGSKSISSPVFIW